MSVKTLPDDLHKLALVARETSDSVIITDSNFIVEWANVGTQLVTGYSSDELRGQNLLELAKAFTLSPETAQHMTAQLGRGERFVAEAQTVHKNGEILYVEFEVFPYRDENGDITAYVGITHDITARAKAERSLRESEEHLRDAQSLAGFGSWRYFVDTEEIRWSAGLFDAMARPTTKAPPTFKEFFDHVLPADRRMIMNHLQAAIRDGKPYEVTFQLMRENGTIAHLHNRGNVRRDATGRVVELYGSTQDITERVRTEKERVELHERLASAQRLESLGLLAGGVAHDFNNLLMGVMMDASLLEREIPSHSSMAESVANIRQAATRMADLTNQLLAYAGRGRFVLERIDPHEVVAKMLDLLRRNLGPEIALEIDIARVPALIEIDSTQLRQVVMNLVFNAADALEGGPGRITVRTRIETVDSQGKVWGLEVTDSGAGMTEEVRRRIFEPFFTTKKTGRGLGLSTVHGIIQRSKGTIDVRSEMGRGTTFEVRLPIINELPTSTPIRAPVLTESRPLHILIADDEAMVRRSLRRMLELNRAQVVEVADGAAAVEAMTNDTVSFDVALIDVIMPRMNGYDVLAEVRARGLRTKIILMSGYNHLDDAPAGKIQQHNPDAVLQKPFAWDELKRIIQQVLEAKR